MEDIPAPILEPGTVLVCVSHSCISAGTELSTVRTTETPLWKRILTQPENIKKGLEMLATQGIARTRSLVQDQMTAGNPTGYSAAGIVSEVGQDIKDMRPGDRVACSGAQSAHHAEMIRVPRNLVVPIPEGLQYPEASTVTLGAISLQGVRRAQPTLGETFVVIGLGILGQLIVQILRSNGCRVIGTDLVRSRIKLAKDLGLDIGIHPEDEKDVEHVMRVTDGVGADGVIVTAATDSDSVISTAFKMCRRKGRVVLVGDVGLNLNRADIYQKELDFLISTSYGPGRYDKEYEEKGIDYPIAYVRWTENRNMNEYIHLLVEGKVKVKPLISGIYPVERAPDAYESLRRDGDRALMVLLSYSQKPEKEVAIRVMPNLMARPAGHGRIRIALIGAGSFAKDMHLPNLQSLSNRFHIQSIASRTGHNAVAAAKQFGANYATTDYRQVLKDPEVDAVLICTRHNLHASIVLEALIAGKHVLVEKPLALTEEELNEIMQFYSSLSTKSSTPILMTGFNRRFSPYAQRIKELIEFRTNPMILNYRMNAGYIPLDHWVHAREGGGRNLGEACHIYDLFTYFTGSKVAQVSAQAIVPRTGFNSPSDNFVATVSFEDGSVASLTYTALGNKNYPKEQMEVFVDGMVYRLDDYRELSIIDAKENGMKSRVPEKGHQEELEAFAAAIQEGGEWPIPLWQQIQATQIALQVEELVRGKQIQPKV